MGRNVRKPTTSDVEKGGEIGKSLFADVIVEIIRNSRGLVRRASKVITEATGASNPCNFGANGLSTTNSCDVRTSAWKLWCELGCLFAIVRLTW